MVRRLTAAKKAELLCRALHIVLILHAAEALRVYVTKSLASTRKHNPSKNIPEPRKGKLEEDSLSYLVSIEIITDEMKKDIIRLINYRNDVGHRIHHFVSDIADHKDHETIPIDEEALGKLAMYKDNIQKGFIKKGGFVHGIEDIEFVFDRAADVYYKEIARLKKVIADSKRPRKRTPTKAPV